MGVLRKGIFDGFENKTGALIGRRVKGKNVISAVPHSAAKTRTPAQLDQQLQFKRVVAFMRSFNELIAIGFAKGKNKGNAFNAAVKFNYKHLIGGTSDQAGIACQKLVYSRGCLAGPLAPLISLGTDEIWVSWQQDRQHLFNLGSDKASFLVYCPEKNLVLKFVDVERRAALAYSINLPPGTTGAQCYVFMSFRSADGKNVSDSRFIGLINI
ncbi:DUF6266 family protein [Pedobacter africanus]|uniref:Uncharacterized protein n=1 Tax=Pedobacter africanus TaxID=151894 RepID=A0A1W2CUK2_9SPHI|nr:DUF6266 family protein [Pedobacter africanus]SMC88919.1 hypothetical protein SAMN04488524_3259 [Pedobacter africanus]